MTGDTVRVVAATLAAVGHRGELNYSINISIGGMEDLASGGGCGCLCGGSWGQNKGRLRWKLCVVCCGSVVGAANDKERREQNKEALVHSKPVRLCKCE
jgi:hypothetical protein